MNLHFEEDIVLAKVSTIRKAVATIRSLDSELPGAEKEWMRLDLTVLNLQRAVEAAIDVACHLISANGWELPRDARHAFEILVARGIISGTLLKVLHAAIGFRNIAVHDYTKLDPQVVRGIAADHLGDLEEFANEVLRKTTASG
jgi:uncharacterized protein YutE (UPF0331/DUF86 family)